MKIVYITSIAGFAGKTLTTLGIGTFLKERGITFTYRKPLANRPVFQNDIIVDDDAYFVAQTLGLDVPLEELSSLILTQDVLVQGFKGELEGAFAKILTHCQKAAQQGEVLLLGGYGSLYTGAFLGVSGLALAKSLGAKVVLVVRYQGEYVIDYILKAQEDLEGLSVGVIFNDLTEPLSYNYRDLVRPYLDRKGLKILGEIPHDPLLAAVSVKELKEYLGAKLLGSLREDRLVEHFLIGGMQVDKAIQYFRRAPNFGVIVGGDRSDIQLAAIETGAVCLLLTGGFYPNEIILARAEEAGVPILILDDDTYSVARKVERLPIQTRIRHPRKTARALELTRKHLNYDLLQEFLS